MAPAGPPPARRGPVDFHVQSTGSVLRDGFPFFSHHETVSALWTEKWRGPCAAGVYPFTDGNVDDFDPIFAELVAISGDDRGILDRPDDYAEPFFPVAEALTAQATAERDPDRRRALHLRAAAVYRIARFPINRSPAGQAAWERGKSAYQAGAALFASPNIPVEIPFGAASQAAGDLAVPIQAYLRTPLAARPKRGWPVVLFVCGLDACRTDHTPRVQEHLDRGFAVLSFEIPGTGDCPAAPNDPTAPERLMTSILDWVEGQAAIEGFDSGRVCARGVSTGGYYALRMAHTHAERLFAVVAQGAGSHRMFDPAWIGAQDQMEYPFALAEALAYKFGYRDTDSATAVQRYTAEASKFSLVDRRVIEAPACRTLVVNGMEDSIFPIEDSILVATHGTRKDLIVRADRGHMGNPGAEEIVYRWLDDAVAGAP